MPGLTNISQIYVPSVEESQLMLTQVESWVMKLKALNVSPDIALYVARDFLSPMRIEAPELVGDGKVTGVPNGEVHAVSGKVYEPAEGIETEGRRKRV